MNTDDDRQRTGHNDQHQHTPARGVESPHNLLAVHDPSKRHITGRQATGRGHGVTVQWLRPTELATRLAAKTAAGAVAAHVAAHRQVRSSVRARLTGEGTGRQARLAPSSAFGHQAGAQRLVAERSVIGR